MKTKSPIQSKTIWGAVIAAVPTLATLLETLGIVTITAPEQEAITAGLSALVTMSGAVLAIYGRLVAKTEIK